MSKPFFRCLLPLICHWSVSFAQSADTLRLQAFRQGRANNCVPVAFIKAAIYRYGVGQVFDTARVEQGVRVTLRDQTQLVITNAERKQAATAANLRATSNTLPPAERAAIISYATLCYAVMAKFIQQKGYYSCLSKRNELGPPIPLATPDFANALAQMSDTGLCTDSGYRHLGLAAVNPQNVELPRPAPDFRHKKGVVVYSSRSNHAVFVLDHQFDDHGEWVALGPTGQWPRRNWFKPQYYLQLR